MKRFGISQRNRSRGNRTWYGRIFDTETGETSYVSLGTTSRQNALDWLAKANAERFLPKRSEPKNPGIGECAEAYLKNIGAVRRRDPGTLAVYSRYLGELSRFCGEQGIAGIADFSARSANGFMASLASKSPQTVSCEIGALRSFFRWAIDDFDIPVKNPFRNIHPPRIAQKPREFWTVEQCERIIGAETNPEYRCFYALMAFAGLRRTEAQKVRAEDIAGGGAPRHRKAREVFVPAHRETPRGIPGRIRGKVGNPGRLPVPPAVQCPCGQPSPRRHRGAGRAFPGRRPLPPLPPLVRLEPARPRGVHQGGPAAHAPRERDPHPVHLLAPASERPRSRRGFPLGLFRRHTIYTPGRKKSPDFSRFPPPRFNTLKPQEPHSGAVFRKIRQKSARRHGNIISYMTRILFPKRIFLTWEWN